MDSWDGWFVVGSNYKETTFEQFFKANVLIHREMSAITLEHTFEVSKIRVSECMADSKFFRCENLGFLDSTWWFCGAVVQVEIKCLVTEHLLEVFNESWFTRVSYTVEPDEVFLWIFPLKPYIVHCVKTRKMSRPLHFFHTFLRVESTTVFIYVVNKRLKKSEFWAECWVVTESSIIHLLELFVPQGNNVTIWLIPLSSIEFLRCHLTTFNSVEKLSQKALFLLMFCFRIESTILILFCPFDRQPMLSTFFIWVKRDYIRIRNECHQYGLDPILPFLFKISKIV